jgi:hemolysin III
MDTVKSSEVSYTAGEETAHSILHGFGALAAAAGLVFIFLRNIFGAGWENPSGLASCVIFAAAMVLMFLISTLYHAIQGKAKRVLRVLDHSVIYIFIAGTYTPMCLYGLKGAWGRSLFFIEWGLAAIGITLYALNLKIIKKIEVIVYILMGWAIIAGWVPLIRSIPLISVVLLISGGVAYTTGTFFYRKKSIRGTHIVWHVFVLIGAACHWFAVWFLK